MLVLSPRKLLKLRYAAFAGFVSLSYTNRTGKHAITEKRRYSGKQRFKEALLPLPALLGRRHSGFPFRPTAPAWRQFVPLRNRFAMATPSALVHARGGRLLPCSWHYRSNQNMSRSPGRFAPFCKFFFFGITRRLSLVWLPPLEWGQM